MLLSPIRESPTYMNIIVQSDRVSNYSKTWSSQGIQWVPQLYIIHRDFSLLTCFCYRVIFSTYRKSSIQQPRAYCQFCNLTRGLLRVAYSKGGDLLERFVRYMGAYLKKPVFCMLQLFQVRQYTLVIINDMYQQIHQLNYLHHLSLAIRYKFFQH